MIVRSPRRIAKLIAVGLLAGSAAAASSAAAADPKFNYLLYCGGCHLEDGSGDPPEVPDLRVELDTLLTISGGRSYLARVPGSSQAPLRDAQLAAVLNWIIDTFYTELPHFERYTAEEVSGYRGQPLLDPLKFRAELMQRR